ncbi:MAG TPA: hypothetical protein VFD25_03230 [Clostridia bacterium]|nr:hypothetical protein [Clostridia bacterium]
MSSYNYSEIVKMQNDALRRVEQMKQNAETVVTQANSQLSGASETSTNSEKEKSIEKARRVPMPDDYIRDLKSYAKKATLSPPVSSPSPKKGNIPSQGALSSLINSCENLPHALKSVLSDFNIDSDRALLLSLILLLAEEHGDEFLIISLLYMMI